MATRNPPKVYFLSMRAQKLTICETMLPTATIGSVKEQVLIALTSDAHKKSQEDTDIPDVKNEEDFELARSVRGKGYEVLEPSTKLKDAKISAWETLYIQFRDSSGELLPVEAEDPPIDDDDELPPPPPMEGIETDSRKGKRKAED